MIFGIGTDIFDVSRIKVMMQKDEGFLHDIFTGNEIAYCNSKNKREENFAARFSAKEAFLKALGTGWRFGIKFTDIEIYHNDLGKPAIRLYGQAEVLRNREGITRMHVSLSHSKDFATAFVVLEKEK